MALLILANGNSTTPYLIKGMRRLDPKRFVLLNEFGKLIDIDERDEKTERENMAVSQAYMAAIQEVIKAGRRWVQPDWVAIREEALTQPTAA